MRYAVKIEVVEYSDEEANPATTYETPEEASAEAESLLHALGEDLTARNQGDPRMQLPPPPIEHCWLNLYDTIVKSENGKTFTFQQRCKHCGTERYMVSKGIIKDTTAPYSGSEDMIGESLLDPRMQDLEGRPSVNRSTKASFYLKPRRSVECDGPGPHRGGGHIIRGTKRFCLECMKKQDAQKGSG